MKVLKIVGVGIALLIVFQIVLGVLFGSSKTATPQPGATPLVSSDTPQPTLSPAELSPAETEKRAAEALRRVYGWQTETTTDKMSGKSATRRSALSINSFNLSFPYQGQQHARLIVRKHPRWGLDVLVEIERGQLICDFDDCTINVRFDDGPIKAYRVNKPSDQSSETFFIANTSPFLAQLSKAKKTFVELTFFQSSSHTVEFLTEGFEPL
jgi:hypothetical protein